MRKLPKRGKEERTGRGGGGGIPSSKKKFYRGRMDVSLLDMTRKAIGPIPE